MIMKLLSIFALLALISMIQCLGTGISTSSKQIANQVHKHVADLDNI